MNGALSELRERVSLLYEQGEAGDVVDWEAAAAELGVASFPSDYREYVAAFGAGSLEASLFISIPRPGSPPAPLTVARLPDDTQEALKDDWKDPAAGARYNMADMLLWGETNGADGLCWVTSDTDPDRWPVAVWARHGGGWNVYECGMTEFLVRVLRADFDECPLSDASLWGEGTARFLNFREEERFLDEGVDPWTGESMDPFAGL